jgi:RNA polymerase sigma-70 factor (ECF subfamily)
VDPAPTPAADPLHPRLARGDEAALGELVERERSRLLRTVRLRLDARLARRVTPEDVLQEAWLAARARLDRYAADGFTRPFTWLRLVVLQVLSDTHRHHLGAQRRDARNEIAVEGGAGEVGSRALALQLSGHLASPSKATMKREALDRLADALERLGPADREVIALRHFEELANDEVAEALGIQGKAASIRYVRALRRLKEELERVGLSVGDLHAV